MLITILLNIILGASILKNIVCAIIEKKNKAVGRFLFDYYFVPFIFDVLFIVLINIKGATLTFTFLFAIFNIIWDILSEIMGCECDKVRDVSDNISIDWVIMELYYVFFKVLLCIVLILASVFSISFTAGITFMTLIVVLIVILVPIFKVLMSYRDD